MEAESILRAGTRLDRYELLCPIASGGMATVWLARLRGKRGFEKLYAIKTIRTELLDDPRFQEMLLDEARIASGIQHPNVAQILDLGEEQDVLFIVMEWVDGDSLAKVRRLIAKRGHRLPVGVVLRILADACAGLHAAHELRDAEGGPLEIVHRDVSPQNVLLGVGGAVKIIDFGIAKAHGRSQGETRTGVVKGKVQYMSPEQVTKDRVVDRRCDVWALGACLHELVSGKLPFDGDTDVEVIRKLIHQEPPKLAEGLPEPVVRVLERSLVLDPDSRFPTAAGMQRALEMAMKELGESATSDDVGAFLRSELPELAQKRRETVNRAVDDSRERGTPSGPMRVADADVAFAPTEMRDRNQPTTDARTNADADPNRASDVVPLVARKRAMPRELPPPTGVSVTLDQEPFEIPKKSKAWLWVTLVVIASGAGAAYRWPATATAVLAAIGIGSAADAPIRRDVPAPKDSTVAAAPVSPSALPSAIGSSAGPAPASVGTTQAPSGASASSAASSAPAPSSASHPEPSHHTWPHEPTTPGARSEPMAPPSSTPWSPYKSAPPSPDNPYDNGPSP